MAIQKAGRREDDKLLHLLPLGHNKRRIPGRRQIWRPLCKVEVQKLEKTNKTDNCENSKRQTHRKDKAGEKKYHYHKLLVKPFHQYVPRSERSENVCKFCGYVIIRQWPRSLHRHYKVTKFYFKQSHVIITPVKFQQVHPITCHKGPAGK